jgi:hypothetical protein
MKWVEQTQWLLYLWRYTMYVATVHLHNNSLVLHRSNSCGLLTEWYRDLGGMARLEVLVVVGMNNTVLGPVTPCILVKLPVFNRNMMFISLSRAGWAVRWSDPGAGEIFRICPDRPCGSPSPLHKGYRISFLGFKRPGRGVNHPSPSSAEDKPRVEQYISPFGPSLPVRGCTLPLTFTFFMLYISGWWKQQFSLNSWYTSTGLTVSTHKVLFFKWKTALSPLFISPSLQTRCVTERNCSSLSHVVQHILDFICD